MDADRRSRCTSAILFALAWPVPVYALVGSAHIVINERVLRTHFFDASGLASAATRIVLVRHLYDLDAVDRIRYSDLQEILREAFQAMRGSLRSGVGGSTGKFRRRAWNATMPICERAISSPGTTPPRKR